MAACPDQQVNKKHAIFINTVLGTSRGEGAGLLIARTHPLPVVYDGDGHLVHIRLTTLQQFALNVEHTAGLVNELNKTSGCVNTFVRGYLRQKVNFICPLSELIVSLQIILLHAT